MWWRPCALNWVTDQYSIVICSYLSVLFSILYVSFHIITNACGAWCPAWRRVCGLVNYDHTMNQAHQQPQPQWAIIRLTMRSNTGVRTRSKVAVENAVICCYFRSHIPFRWPDLSHRNFHSVIGIRGRRWYDTLPDIICCCPRVLELPQTMHWLPASATKMPWKMEECKYNISCPTTIYLTIIANRKWQRLRWRGNKSYPPRTKSETQSMAEYHR